MVVPGGGAGVLTKHLVHLVDDSASLRAMTAAILDEAGIAVKEHVSALSLLAAPADIDGDCIITDIRMPPIDGLEFLMRLRAAGATVPVIVLTGHGDVATAVRAMKLGACDFIEKPFHPTTLLAAVRAAINGRGGGARDVSPAVIAEQIGRLTPRERQVMALILIGRTHREIGEELTISPRTVEVFRARIMTKMDCRTVQDLVRAAMRAGYP